MRAKRDSGDIQDASPEGTGAGNAGAGRVGIAAAGDEKARTERTGPRSVERLARDVMGFAGLRPGQRAAAEALAGGRDRLVVMPGGSGKSAIYQLAAVALGGPAVVVSPLLSLQRDQVGALRGRRLPAVALNARAGAGRRAEHCRMPLFPAATGYAARAGCVRPSGVASEASPGTAGHEAGHEEGAQKGMKISTRGLQRLAARLPRGLERTLGVAPPARQRLLGGARGARAHGWPEVRTRS